MQTRADQSILDRARDAAARGDWQHAYDLLVEADMTQGVGGTDLILLANTAYAAGHLDVTIDAWERAHADALRGGDRLAAAGAAARVALHLLMDTALLAPVRGWTARAERLLEGQADTPVHAWLAVVHSYERLLSGDLERAQEWARRAIEIGTGRDPAAAAIGRLAEARSVLLSGDVTRGLELLNEAAVATMTGELDPVSTGLVYCEVVCAMQAIAQYDLAEQWTEAMERWHQGQPVGSMHGRCRLHRAEILRLRGSCVEAEQEALRACAELRPYLRRELGWPLTELGRIRLRKGDISGAEAAFVEAHELGWDPHPGLALVRLAQGDLVRAVSLIRDALDHPLNVPSKELPPNTELRRAPLLEAQVEIEIAAGDIDRARAAADELSQVAARFESTALIAGATLAQGRVRMAMGDPAGARRHFEAAAEQWRTIGAPYEAATARMALAGALRAEGSEARAILEFEAARAAFERIGAQGQGNRAANAIAGTRPVEGVRPSHTAPQRAPDAAANQEDNRFRREGEYWSVAFDGQTLRLKDAVGLRYLVRLLAHPAREFHVLDLVAGEHPDVADLSSSETPMRLRIPGDAGEALDARAKQSYRRRLAEIDHDLEEAQQFGDSVRAEQAIAERAFLARELSRAVGLGGRDRRAVSTAERARASVTRAVRHAMQRIRTHHPVLGTHLERSIRTGAYCVYLPDPRVPVNWRV
jgi:tetratricopeptide (TPR) repeat protein